MNDFQYNRLQRQLLEDYIDTGGRLNIYQSERAAGYTTFVVMECLRHAVETGRSTVFIHDSFYAMSTMCDIAVEVFGLEPKLNRVLNTVTIGDTVIRFIRPDRFGDRVRGRVVEDVFGEIDRKTHHGNYEDFFRVLRHRQHASSADGNGMYLMVIR